VREGGATIARPEACVYAGLCARICPSHAIRLPIEVVFAEKQNTHNKERGT
jgi:ferredoxin